LRAPELKVGSIYYQVLYREATPIITSYEYRGPVDAKPHTHFFKAVGLSDANLFLEDRDLKQIVDIAGLKVAVGKSHAS